MLGAAEPGGAETFFLRMCKALSLMPEVELLPVVRDSSWASSQLNQMGVEHATAPFGGLFDSAITGRTARRMRKLAADFRPDVIQSWMNRATLFVPSGDWQRVGRLGGYYDLGYYRGHADYLVGITDHLCEHCINGGWPASHVRMIGNFALDPKPGWQDQRAAVREKYGIPADAKVCMVAGRLHRVKGVDLAIRALAQLPSSTWLLLAGDGPERAAMEQLVQEQGVADRVTFAGWINDIGIPAAATDIWLVPSRHEPMGNTVLDAWAYGKPMVAAKASGPKSLIDHGKTALLFEIDDADGLRDAIKMYLDDPQMAASVAAAGHQNHLGRFSEGSIIGQYMDFYREIIGPKKA